MGRGVKVRLTHPRRHGQLGAASTPVLKSCQVLKTIHKCIMALNTFYKSGLLFHRTTCLLSSPPFDLRLTGTKFMAIGATEHGGTLLTRTGHWPSIKMLRQVLPKSAIPLILCLTILLLSHSS